MHTHLLEISNHIFNGTRNENISRVVDKIMLLAILDFKKLYKTKTKYNHFIAQHRNNNSFTIYKKPMNIERKTKESSMRIDEDGGGRIFKRVSEYYVYVR